MAHLSLRTVSPGLPRLTLECPQVVLVVQWLPEWRAESSVPVETLLVFQKSGSVVNLWESIHLWAN